MSRAASEFYNTWLYYVAISLNAQPPTGGDLGIIKPALKRTSSIKNLVRCVQFILAVDMSYDFCVFYAVN